MTRSEGADPADLGVPVRPARRPATPESVRAHVDSIRARQGWSGARSDAERAALERTCPWCHAAVGEGCASPSSRHRPRRFFVHERRLGSPPKRH